ncbi:hypothetical protein DFH94DRAFT_163923 [Russula ochroleuca]|uniref:Fungal STAND N-terminal Goodbye domain-containing protein n=1 Tax=Russula ochroleuca TaxID=152965 RepID=A0A9P5N4D6_9AGAM|nr:hypothetical protein DFH94DRAFT_163923 [Russula ochroleuca]
MWLDPTVNVLNAISATTGGFVGIAYPPVGVIFTGIGILLSAAQGISAGREALVDLFDRIENIFRRLETYLEIPPTIGMTDAIVKVMVEVLRILAIATNEIKQNRAKKFLKKLVGRTDIEDALQRLEKVTLEEARMAGAEAQKAIHGVGNQVGDKVDGVQDTLKVVEDKMKGVEGMLQGVGDILQEIGNKVITGVEKTGQQLTNDFDKNAHGVDDEMRSIDDTVQGVNTRQDIGANVIDGAQVTPNQSPTPS